MEGGGTGIPRSRHRHHLKANAVLSAGQGNRAGLVPEIKGELKLWPLWVTSDLDPRSSMSSGPGRSRFSW